MVWLYTYTTFKLIFFCVCCMCYKFISTPHLTTEHLQNIMLGNRGFLVIAILALCACALMFVQYYGDKCFVEKSSGRKLINTLRQEDSHVIGRHNVTDRWAGTSNCGHRRFIEYVTL
jgi:hypothetical protein